MTNLKESLQTIFKGELDDSEATKITFSHDASLFELVPKVIARPKDAQDIESLVKYISENKKAQPELSLTARSGGTDMSGGAINESIVMDMTKYFTAIHSVSKTEAHLQPGVYFRDFDAEAIKQNVLMPSYPASRELCTIGGMIANNSGGEKSLEYGKTEDFVTELEVVFADGKTYKVVPLSKSELDAKIAQNDFEGNLYKQTLELIEAHYDEIKAAKPQVTKNSMGYNLWDVWDKETQIFDLTKLIVGSQGTLGIVTDIKVRLVERREFSGLLVCFMKDITNLGDVINATLAHKPATFESFDDNTLWLSFKFFPFFRKTLGLWGLAKLGISLLPNLLMLARGIPKLILMAEFNGATQQEVTDKIEALRKSLKPFGMAMEEDETAAKSKKFWIMRRESFNLLRKKVKDKHTAPFIDDFVVAPKYLPEFLPQLRDIIKKYKLLATIAGHMGDGNFHVIPLMRIEDPKERAKLEPVMREVNELVLKYKGSLSGEHNDGLVRGPWLEEMYGPSIYGYFKDVKHIFDEQNIFNPHKKTDADWDFSMKHIRENFNQ